MKISISFFANKTFLFFLILAIGFLGGCKRDPAKPNKPNPDDQIDHGFITSVKLLFKDSANANDTREFVFSDPDGPGGLPPSRIDTIKLDNGKTWLCSIKFFDDTDNGKDLTPTIKQEEKDHIMCYIPSGTISQSLSIYRTDWDGKYEVGLESKWYSLSEGIGGVTCILKHQVGIKDGTCTPGSTDVEVVFPTIIE